ncbi:MAG: oligosaccharide flippase family protein [Phycisphaerales bacterium]
MTRWDASSRTDSADAMTAARPDPMGAQLGRGVSWLMVAAALGKAGALVSNIVLGWVLLKQDFGLFAFAAGVAGFASVFRDGGVRQLIIQRGQRRYRRLSGPAFWLSVTMSGAAGAILAVLGPVFAIGSGKPVASLLAVMGLGVALAGAAAVYRGKIAVDLQYRRLAELNALVSFTRYGSMIVLALLGFGAMSLALPWVIVAVVEFAFGWWVTRDAPWTRPPGLRAWPAILKRTVWLIVGQIGISLINTGDYLVLSLLQAAGVVGVYYFAFQLIDQTNVLLAVSLQTALFPALSVLAGEPKRHAQGVVRSARVMMVVGTALALGTACTIGPLEQLIWRFKWIDAVVPVQILALFFPLRMMMVVYNSAMMSRGLFVPRAVQMMIIAAGVMLTAGIVGAYTGDVDHISLALGAYHGVVAFGLMVVAMRAVNVRPLAFLGAVLPALAIGVGAMAASVWIDALWTLPAVARATDSDPSLEIPLAIARLIALGGVFTLLYVAGMRAARPGDLQTVINVIPGRVRATVRRVLLLKPA